MNTEAGATHIHGVFSLLMSMIATRIELAAIDVEELAYTVVTTFMTAFVAVVLSLIAFAFAGVAVITLFWDTHRVAAAVGVTLCYAMFAVLVAWRARANWRARPAAFAGTLRELELDGEAFGRQP